MKLLFKTFVLLNVITLLSCSPTKQLERLLAKNPEMVKSDTVTIVKQFIVNDTIVEIDTFITKEVSVKHLFKFDTDTVYISEEGKVRTEVKVITKNVPYPVLEVVTNVESDTLIQVDTLRVLDTFYIEVYKVITEYDVVKKRSFWSKLKGVLITIGVTLLIVFILLLMFGIDHLKDFFKRL